MIRPFPFGFCSEVRGSGPNARLFLSAFLRYSLPPLASFLSRSLFFLLSSSLSSVLVFALPFLFLYSPPLRSYSKDCISIRWA